MTSKPRCVVDTNVLISAFLSPSGKPNKVVRWVLADGVLLESVATFEELETSIRRPKFEKYAPLEELEAYLGLIFDQTKFIAITETVSACVDPDDDNFLELAVSGKADYLITGNTKDFPPNQSRGIPILTFRRHKSEREVSFVGADRVPFLAVGPFSPRHPIRAG